LDNFEEALRNIDAFCRVLVNKMVEGENTLESNIVVEPMKKILQRKYIMEEHSKPSPLAKHLIPLPHVEEPLIDIFEDDNYVKVLMQCRCKTQKVTVHTNTDVLEICNEECRRDAEDVEICTDRCQELGLPAKNLQFENMTVKCNKNTVLELEIPKIKTY